MATAHYDYSQIKQIWLSNGGSPKLADTMAAVALAETGGTGYSGALNDNPNTGDYSVGLWQINYFGGLRGPRTARYGSPSALRNDVNAQARAAIDLVQGGSGLHNWTTYTSGKYRVYLGSGSSKSGIIGGATSAIGGAESAVGGAVGGAGSAVGGFISSLNPISGIEGAIKDLAMKFVYSLAIMGGGLLVLLGILMVGAELGIEQAGNQRGVRVARNQVGKIGPMRAATKIAEKKGQNRGYKEGFGQGEMYSSDKESRKQERQNVKEFQKSKRLPLKEARTGKSDDIPY